MQKKFDFLIVGRVNGDLVLNGFTPEIRDKGVTLNKNGTAIKIRTDSTPSSANDKVNSIERLEEKLETLEIGKDFDLRWGGGGFNSAMTLAGSSVLTAKKDVAFLSPTKPDLIIGSKKYGLLEELDSHGIKGCCMNFVDLNYNLVIGGTNKLVVRNRASSKPYILRPEHSATIESYIEPAYGVLINALNHPKMTEDIVQKIHNENEIFYEAMKKGKLKHPSQIPSYRTVITVVTSGISMRDLIEEIFPYTGLIFNEEDIVKTFFGSDARPDTEHKRAIQAIAQLRYGIPKSSRVRAKVVDTNNAIYVSLGREGYIVGLGNQERSDEYYHLRTNEKTTIELDERIKENNGSTNGAGDAFAAAVLHQETIGEGSDYIKTSAVINTVVSRQLDLTRTVHDNQIEVVSSGSLKAHYRV